MMCGLAIHCETAIAMWFELGGITTFIDYLHRDAASKYMVNWFYKVADVSLKLYQLLVGNPEGGSIPRRFPWKSANFRN